MYGPSLEHYIQSLISVSPADLQRIHTFVETETLPKGAYYGRPGGPCHRIGFIQEGYIRFYYEANDREVTQWIAGPGTIAADSSAFMLQLPGRWHMQALTECRMQNIAVDAYHKLRAELPAFNEFDRQLIVKCFVFMEDRMFRHLYMSTEERFQHLVNTQPELFNFVPLQYLASMMGMTPETLSRLRKKIS